MPGRLIGLFEAGQPLIGCQQINSFLKSLGENKLLFNGASAVAVEEQLASVTQGNGSLSSCDGRRECITLSSIMIAF